MSKDKDMVYCICRTKKEGFMIFCDSCEEWYHGACLHIKKGTELPKKWICLLCCRMQSLERRFYNEIKNLRAAMTKELQNSEQKIKELEAQKLEGQTRKISEELQEQLASAKSQIKILEEEKDKNLKSTQALIMKHSSEIASLKAENEKALSDLKSKHELEAQKFGGQTRKISELQKQLASARSQLKILEDERAENLKSTNGLILKHAAEVKYLKAENLKAVHALNTKPRKKNSPLQLKRLSLSQPTAKDSKRNREDSFSEEERDAFKSLK